MRFTHPILPFGLARVIQQCSGGELLLAEMPTTDFSRNARRSRTAQSVQFWIMLEKGLANADGTIPTADLARSHKFGSNEERQFVDLLPGAANWKQKVDSL